MAASPLGTHLRACAQATIQAVGGETISYRPLGVHANKRDVAAIVERNPADIDDRGRRVVWRIHVEDHATRGITKPNNRDEVVVDEFEGDGSARISMSYSSTVLDDGTGIVVMEWRR